LLANLAAAVEGRELPWPEGYLAAIFGYRREGATICGVERSVWLPRTPEQVWPAVSTPAGIEGWFSPGTPWVLTELAPQGRLFVRDPESGGELYTQIIARVEAPLLLVLNSLPTADGPAQSSDHILTPEGGGTRMTLTNYGYERLPADGRAATLEQTAFGFGMVMENFYASVVGEPLPYPGGF
ncbi:MAG: SRPBCC family protein, partial [Caldilineaceae bacterium]